MKKNKRWLLVVGVLVVLMGGFYIIQSMHYRDHFLPNTEILGVDVSGQTFNAANKKLTDQSINVSTHLLKRIKRF